jgi:release factor glutamine methyltransferase
VDGGVDGLDVLRRVARLAPGRLAPGGVLLVEVAEEQAEAAAAAFAASGLVAAVEGCDDLAATAVVGRRP